jgi:hypothetical protein
MDRRSCSLREAKAIEERIIQECKTRKTMWQVTQTVGSLFV